jgi:hypothetical protein
MRGAIPPLPQYAFLAWCSVKTQGQLHLYILPIGLRSDITLNKIPMGRDPACTKVLCHHVPGGTKNIEVTTSAVRFNSGTS